MAAVTRDDVAIVGAGPAGAWAAYRLARAGARVIVFDASHPREKPCGGGITGRALGLIREIRPDRALPAVSVARASFEAAPAQPGAAGDAVEFPLPSHGITPDSALVVTSRAAFDGALLDAAVRAGARHVSRRVTDVTVTVGGVEVRTADGAVHAAAWVLGADGANSLVRRRLARPFTRAQLSIATGFFARGVTADDIAIACVADPPGYIWSFPRPDHLAVGIGVQANHGTTAPSLRARVAAWLRRTGRAPGMRLDPYSWPIPSLPAADLTGERPAGRRWMLLGDAAGLVDPLTREGIYFALLSAQWAAEALTRDAARAAEGYLGRVRDELYPELARAARARDAFFRPAFTGLMVQALRRSAPIREVMVDLIAGRQPYRGLRRRLLRTFEWGLAARLLGLALGGQLAATPSLPGPALLRAGRPAT
jgi:geranylgeranyl reductase family protein